MFTFNKTFIAAALHNICRVYTRKAFKVQRTAIFQLLHLYYGAPHLMLFMNYVKFKGKSYKIKLQLIEKQHFIFIRGNNIFSV